MFIYIVYLWVQILHPICPDSVQADVGPSCAVRLVDELRDEVEINGLHTGQEALDALRDIIRREVSPKTDLDLQF